MQDAPAVFDKTSPTLKKKTSSQNVRSPKKRFQAFEQDKAQTSVVKLSAQCGL